MGLDRHRPPALTWLRRPSPLRKPPQIRPRPRSRPMPAPTEGRRPQRLKQWRRTPDAARRYAGARRRPTGRSGAGRRCRPGARRRADDGRGRRSGRFPAGRLHDLHLGARESRRRLRHFRRRRMVARGRRARPRRPIIARSTAPKSGARHRRCDAVLFHRGVSLDHDQLLHDLDRHRRNDHPDRRADRPSATCAARSGARATGCSASGSAPTTIPTCSCRSIRTRYTGSFVLDATMNVETPAADLPPLTPSEWESE